MPKKSSVLRNSFNDFLFIITRVEISYASIYYKQYLTVQNSYLVRFVIHNVGNVDPPFIIITAIELNTF